MENEQCTSIYNMNKSHSHTKEQKKPSHKNYTVSHSIHKKYKTPQKCSMMLEVRIVGTFEGSSD